MSTIRKNYDKNDPPYLLFLPSHVSEKLQQLIQEIGSDTEGDSHHRMVALQQLCDYTRLDKYQYAIISDSSLNIVSLFVDWLDRFSHESRVVFYITACVWYLSRNSKATEHLCQPLDKCGPSSTSLLILLLTQYLHLTLYNINVNILNALSNCCLNQHNHRHLLAHPSFDLLSLASDDIFHSPTTSRHYRTLGCLASMIHSSDVVHLLAHPFLERMTCRLIEGGPHPSRWIDRFVGSEIWSLYALLSLSSHCHSHCLVRQRMWSLTPSLLHYLHELSTTSEIEGLNAAIILLNLSSSGSIKEEGEALTLRERLRVTWFHHSGRGSLLEDLLAVYDLTLSGDQTSSLFVQMSDKGFSYGMLRVHVIALTLKLLCRSSQQTCRLVFAQQERLVPLLHRTVRLFVDDAPECTARVAFSLEEAGGGGSDVEAVLHVLEIYLLYLDYLMTPETEDSTVVKDCVDDVKAVLSLSLEGIEERERRCISYDAVEGVHRLCHAILERAGDLPSLNNTLPSEGEVVERRETS